MQSLMQQHQLLLSGLIDHAAAFHGEREIVSHMVDGSTQRSNWRQLRQRAKRLANALTTLGIQAGDRVATLAWNTHRHMELYFGVSGMQAVLHTVNPRLFPEQISYILNHAEDGYLMFHTNHPVAEAHPDYEIGFEIAFGEGEILAGQPLLRAVKQLSQSVSGIAEAFLKAGLLA